MRLGGVRRWLRVPLTDRRKTELDVDAELASHLEERVARLMAEGLTEEHARAEAERRFGGLASARRRLVQEAWERDVALARRERRRAWLDDLRYAARVLRRGPLFTCVAVCSLGLAFALIASTTALVNAYLLRSMPFPEADRLYRVIYAPPGEREPDGLSALDWGELDTAIEHADNSAPARLFVGMGVDRREIMGLLVARGSLELLGVTASLGRSLNADDFAGGSEPVALVGHKLWRGSFGADPAIIGRLFEGSRASGGATESFRIVGVLPQDFRYAREYARGALDFVVPLRQPMRAYMVRLREGVSAAEAQRLLDDAVRRTATSLPQGWSGVQLESVHEGYVAGLRPVLFAITAAGGLVLVITSINLAVLMLLRSLRRQREWAVRRALGAGGGRLARMQLAESGLVAGGALVLGLLTSVVALRTLAPLVEERLGRDAPGGAVAIAIDWRVLLVVGGTGVLIALLLGCVPLLSPWQRRLAETLRRADRSSTDGSAARRMRSVLVSLQLAASVTLLFGCGLMVRTVLNLVRTDLGYRTEEVLRARIAMPLDKYVDPLSFLAFYDQLTERLIGSPLPFAVSTSIPFYEYPQDAIEVDGHEERSLSAARVAVTEGYFDVFDITLQEGRGFSAADRLGAEPVAIVSASLAGRLGPPGSAIGRRLRVGSQEATEAEWRTIIGVVSAVRQTHTDTDLDDVYVPFSQSPGPYASLYMRTAQPPLAWIKELRAHVAAIDPFVLVTGDAVTSSMVAQEARLLAGPRFLMAVLTGFALFAALLTALGVYGVTAYGVQQRQRELAIRAAVGATHRQLILLFMRDGARVLAVGLGAGVFGAAAVGSLLQNQLHGVRPHDVLTLVTAAVLLGTVVLLASWWPAARGDTAPPARLLNQG